MSTPVWMFLKKSVTPATRMKLIRGRLVTELLTADMTTEKVSIYLSYTHKCKFIDILSDISWRKRMLIPACFIVRMDQVYQSMKETEFLIPWMSQPLTLKSQTIGNIIINESAMSKVFGVPTQLLSNDKVVMDELPPLINSRVEIFAPSGWEPRTTSSRDAARSWRS